MRHPSLVLLLVAAAACSDPAGQADAGPPLIDCGLAMEFEVRMPGGEYAPIATGGDVELVLGFQGFKFIYVRARLDRRPAVTTTTVQASVEGSEPRSQRIVALDLYDDGAGGFVSEPEQFFFNDEPLPALADRLSTLLMIVGDEACSASQSGVVTLRYDEGCVESADGGLVCADGGP